MTLPERGVFVTGTDTGVGKTVVSTALVRALRGAGLDVAAMKPIETGVDDAGPLDAIALREAAGSRDSLDDICPVQLALPAAPTVAAEAEGVCIELSTIDRAFARLCTGRNFAVVEGAGGLLVPILPGASMADLALHFGLPALVVARASLGTINHARLTLEAAETRGLPVVGVVISHVGGRLSAPDAANLVALKDFLGERLIGEIPPLEGSAASAESYLDLAPVLAAKRFASRPIKRG